jgi:hypothetical protein
VESKLAAAEIRGLQCRTSLCAIEVASTAGFLNLLIEDEQRAYGVYDLSHFAMEYETDPSGARVAITWTVFERRVQ